MAYFQSQAEEGRKCRNQAQHETQRDIGRQAGDILAQKACPAIRAARAQKAGDARVVANHRIDVAQHKPVFRTASDQAADKQQHAGKGGEEHGWPQQTQRVQHLARMRGAERLVADKIGIAQRQQQRPWEDDEHVAQNGSHLGAHQMSDFVDELLDGAITLDVLELGRHGRRRHGRLLGGHREVQHLDQHKADGVVEARSQSRPEDGQAQRIQRKLGQRGEGHHQAAARGLGHHLAVFAAVAGDVVLAGFGAALGHLGRQQR